MEDIFMKKIRSIIVACLLVLCFCVFSGCGNNDNNNNGSSVDLQSTAGEHENTATQPYSINDGVDNESKKEGVLEPVITDAATEIEKIATDAASKAQEAVTRASDDIQNNSQR